MHGGCVVEVDVERFFETLVTPTATLLPPYFDNAAGQYGARLPITAAWREI